MLRALIDNCARTNAITSEACEKLKLPMKKTTKQITGLNQSEPMILHGEVEIEITPKRREHLIATCVVMDQVTAGLNPEVKLPDELNDAMQVFPLADNTFDQPGKVELLLGQGVYTNIVGQHIERVGQTNVTETHLGWIVGGKANIQSIRKNEPNLGLLWSPETDTFKYKFANHATSPPSPCMPQASKHEINAAQSKLKNSKILVNFEENIESKDDKIEASSIAQNASTSCPIDRATSKRHSDENFPKSKNSPSEKSENWSFSDSHNSGSKNDTAKLGVPTENSCLPLSNDTLTSPLAPLVDEKNENEKTCFPDKNWSFLEINNSKTE